jgi:transcriptional regulator with XRE-family HTH domain
MQAGLSQGQVARLMDMHRPSISEMEAGRRKVAAEELSALAKHYGVSVSWLACEDNDSPNEDDDRIQLAARELSKLKRQDFDKVISLLTAMKGSKSK